MVSIIHMFIQNYVSHSHRSFVFERSSALPATNFHTGQCSYKTRIKIIEVFLYQHKQYFHRTNVNSTSPNKSNPMADLFTW